MPRRPPAVARVLERVTKTAREHEMFEAGDLVLVSCSGGPDSVCLLYSLWHLRRLFKIRLAVFHFDHKLRPDSAKDGAYVRRLSERLKLPFYLREANDAPIKGESIEAWAREARQAAAQDAAEDIDATRVAEGHTLDDQAETVLMGAITGGSLFAVAGIWPSQFLGSQLASRVQPLIDVPREGVEAFCRALRLSPRRDPSNDDTAYLRNAIRVEGLPALESATGRRVREPLVRLADDARPIAIETLLAKGPTAKLDQGRPTKARGKRGEWVALGVGLFDHRSTLEAKALVRGWLKHLRLPVSREAIDAVLDLAEGRPGRKRDLPEGLKAVREKEYVRVSRTSPEK